MKTITKPLIGFISAAFVLSVAFRFALSYLLDLHNINMLIILSILYFLLMFAMGWYFGKKDYEFLPIYDIGFRFHAATFLMYNIVGELWFVLGLNSDIENIRSKHLGLLIWSIFIVIHLIVYLILRRHSIDNLDKRKIFE